MEITRKTYNDSLCLLRTLALHSHGNGELEKITSKLFTVFIEKIWGTNPASFQGVCMNDISNMDDLFQESILVSDVHFHDGARIGELARRSVGKHSNTIQFWVGLVTIAMYPIPMLF